MQWCGLVILTPCEEKTEIVFQRAFIKTPFLSNVTFLSATRYQPRAQKSWKLKIFFQILLDRKSFGKDTIAPPVNKLLMDYRYMVSTCAVDKLFSVRCILLTTILTLWRTKKTIQNFERATLWLVPPLYKYMLMRVSTISPHFCVDELEISRTTPFP